MINIDFILGGSVVAVLLVQILKAIIGKIEGRYGTLLTQFILLCVSFFIAGLGAVIKLLPPEILQGTIDVAVGAVAIYEVIYKGIWQQAIRGKV